MDYSCHSALGVDYWQRVEVVFVEEFGYFGLVHVGGTASDAWFGEDGEMAGWQGEDHAGGRQSRRGEEIEFGRR